MTQAHAMSVPASQQKERQRTIDPGRGVCRDTIAPISGPAPAGLQYGHFRWYTAIPPHRQRDFLCHPFSKCFAHRAFRSIVGVDRARHPRSVAQLPFSHRGVVPTPLTTLACTLKNFLIFTCPFLAAVLQSSPGEREPLAFPMGIHDGI